MKSRIPHQRTDKSAPGRPRAHHAPRRLGPIKPADAVKAILAEVLLLEDEVIIALDVELMLRELGAANVRVAQTAEEGLRLIEAVKPSFALLDVNLGGQMNYTVAVRLFELNTPFAFASGYLDSREFTEVYGHVPLLSKPYGPSDIRNVVEACLRGGGKSAPPGGWGA